MTLFKYPIPRFRRRPARYFPDAPQSDGALSVGGELDKLARSVSNPYARKVCLCIYLVFQRLLTVPLKCPKALRIRNAIIFGLLQSIPRGHSARGSFV